MCSSQKGRKLGNGSTNLVNIYTVRRNGIEYQLAGKIIIMFSSEEQMDMYAIDEAQIRAMTTEVMVDGVATGGILWELGRELDLHAPLEHPRIAKLEGIIYKVVKNVRIPFLCLQELGKGGTLDGVIETRDKTPGVPPSRRANRGKEVAVVLDNQLLRSYLTQLFDSVAYLHSQHVMHRFTSHICGWLVTVMLSGTSSQQMCW